MARKVPTGHDYQGTGRASNLVDAAAATDAVTLQQVQALLNGLAWKASARVKTTANVTLASGLVSGTVIDGVTLATNDRVLVASQTTGSENGIYVVPASGAATRATDADSAAELLNATLYVREGTTNADTSWTQTVDAITLGTTTLTFVRQNAGQSYAGSATILLSSGAFSVILKSGGMLGADANGLYVDLTALAARLVTKYAADVAAGSTSVTVTHNLGTVDRLGEPVLTLKSSGEVGEWADITLGVNADVLTFAVAPTSGQYRYSTAA